MILFSGSSNPDLAQKLRQKAKIKLGKVDLSSFPNKELRVRIRENVKDQSCALLQSFSDPAEKHLVEFCLMVDALIRAGALKITALIPWFGYSLQDKVFKTGEPISAKVVANIVSSSGISRLALLHLHNPSIAGFFSIPAITLESHSLFINYIKRYKLDKKAIVVSPDFGAMKKARGIAKKLRLSQVNINKERDLKTGQVKAQNISNSVKAKNCLVFDDLISTGGTVVETAKILKKEGALKIYFFSTHALLSGEASKKLAQSPIDQVVVTDSVKIPESKKFRQLKILSLSSILAKFLKK